MSDHAQTHETGAMTSTGAGAIVEFLHGRGVAFELVEHPPTMSAAAEAEATHEPKEHVAKTIVLQHGPSYAIAAVPASERLDVEKLRDVIGTARSLRLATEEEIAKDFPALEVGAAPPIGPMLPMAEVIDRRLLEHRLVLCAGGDHRHSILLDPRDLVRVSGAKVADICEEH